MIINTMKLIFGMAALTATLLPAMAEQDDRNQPACSVATIKGSYGLTLSGKTTGYDNVSGVGAVTIDGAGKYTGTTTGVASLFGVSTVFTTPVHGTYTLKSDCSGTVVVNFVNLHLTVDGVTVFTNGGKDGRFVVTSAGAQLTGTAQRQ